MKTTVSTSSLCTKGVKKFLSSTQRNSFSLTGSACKMLNNVEDVVPECLLYETVNTQLRAPKPSCGLLISTMKEGC